MSACCEIKGFSDLSNEQAKMDAETLMRAAPPEWACWKTGVELSCFGAKLLRVCQLEETEPYYGGKRKSEFSLKSKTQKLSLYFPMLQLMKGRQFHDLQNTKRIITILSYDIVFNS